jgi:hypothetical protein
MGEEMADFGFHRMPDRIAALSGDAGFSAVAYRRLKKGIAVIHRGIKR